MRVWTPRFSTARSTESPCAPASLEGRFAFRLSRSSLLAALAVAYAISGCVSGEDAQANRHDDASSGGSGQGGSNSGTSCPTGDGSNPFDGPGSVFADASADTGSLRDASLPRTDGPPHLDVFLQDGPAGVP